MPKIFTGADRALAPALVKRKLVQESTEGVGLNEAFDRLFHPAVAALKPINERKSPNTKSLCRAPDSSPK